MPTPEEIKNLCMEYAESVKSEYVSAKLIETLVMGFYHSRLKNDYCIVPKSKLKEEYRTNQGSIIVSTHIHEPDLIENFKGCNEQLETLFGTKLFNEE